MTNYSELAKNPIFFERNRVFRVYKGGKLFHNFFGDEAIDSNYPEEWIASSVHALNKDSISQYEGISKIKGTDVYFDDLLNACKDLLLGPEGDLAILVKVLDSAIRLPIQAHPDKKFSQKYFKSDYGKAECWVVLETRPDAKLYFGFDHQLSKEEIKLAIEKSETDKNAMIPLINQYPANKGDVFFIPPKVVHAIGYGCLILEIQEPTDFTIQPEAWCGDYHLNEYEMYLGLDKDIALSCFDYTVYGKASIDLGKKLPTVLYDTPTLRAESLIGKKDTPCFSVNRYSIKNDSMILENYPAIYVVTDGDGVLKSRNQAIEIKKGDYFFLPYCLRDICAIEAQKHIELVQCIN